MKNLNSIPFEYDDDDTNKTKLKTIWGDSLNKLTPKQRQLIVKILSNKVAEKSRSHYKCRQEAPAIITSA